MSLMFLSYVIESRQITLLADNFLFLFTLDIPSPKIEFNNNLAITSIAEVWN